MAETVLQYFSELPFFGYYFDTITKMFETPKNVLLERLKNNSFSENMIKLVNGFSKDNYTCSYYQEESINELSKKHSANSLKVFHNNIESFGKNSTNLIVNLECLKFYFDIIRLTEVRKTSIGIINMVFTDYHVFLDNPDTAKGGVALMIRHNKFSNITELGSSSGFDLKNICDCTHCKTENKWLALILMISLSLSEEFIDIQRAIFNTLMMHLKTLLAISMMILLLLYLVISI